MFKIKKGLDLPIAGAPRGERVDAKTVRSVAVLGEDYPGMKPTMAVAEGDRVKQGQILFADKKTEGVVFTAPAAGTVASINRGAKRAFIGLVIDVDGDAAETFTSYAATELPALERQTVVDQLLQSGAWTALRTRPFSRIPDPQSTPNSVFVTAMDTNPLAADPKPIIAAREAEFAAGLTVLGRLTDGAVHLCQDDSESLAAASQDGVTNQVFAGPHPAGLPGTHIHFVDPVSSNKTVWFIGYQDVIAIGSLFLNGSVLSERIVALGGPGVTTPRLLRTSVGANLDELTAGELAAGEQRVISGSILAGHTARGQHAFLGRYHTQVSVLPEDRERKLFGWLVPGAAVHSVFPAFLSKWIGEKSVSFSTNTNGSTRAMVPIGTYDDVIPMDILATPLMRSLLVGDVEKAIGLGCLELDEEDVALCTYACPGKYEFGPVLRDLLTQIEKEG
ncbi:MAG: Na(+)-translocating NADH-quinone reductase subunit A [Proteobacteria bacterium]|nr:Na(+)-translocating NADH-quinone reductase subunit A [Pseudomonadota bacterium]